MYLHLFPANISQQTIYKLNVAATNIYKSLTLNLDSPADLDGPTGRSYKDTVLNNGYLLSSYLETVAAESGPAGRGAPWKVTSWWRMCCARGRPIIVEWERDARHSAGLSLVRDIERRVKAENKVNGALLAIINSKSASRQARLAIHSEVMIPTLMYGTENRRVFMEKLMDVGEVRAVSKDRTIWRSIVSEYLSGNLKNDSPVAYKNQLEELHPGVEYKSLARTPKRSKKPITMFYNSTELKRFSPKPPPTKAAVMRPAQRDRKGAS
ncbi:hypothetical protein EVAR_75679_1 [Eumeta japonica]|uniref:Uncharacterized protein n=1 Tax=Eumeta variegata TaxID=151549 RepID=A0A4C1W162_EUMVA|nr:hypothetical protein EVAR_75679_1 [Eumeta japonica]